MGLLEVKYTLQNKVQPTAQSLVDSRTWTQRIPDQLEGTNIDGLTVDTLISPLAKKFYLKNDNSDLSIIELRLQGVDNYYLNKNTLSLVSVVGQ